MWWQWVNGRDVARLADDCDPVWSERAGKGQKARNRWRSRQTEVCVCARVSDSQPAIHAGRRLSRSCSTTEDRCCQRGKDRSGTPVSSSAGNMGVFVCVGQRVLVCGIWVFESVLMYFCVFGCLIFPKSYLCKFGQSRVLHYIVCLCLCVFMCVPFQWLTAYGLPRLLAVPQSLQMSALTHSWSSYLTWRGGRVNNSGISITHTGAHQWLQKK